MTSWRVYKSRAAGGRTCRGTSLESASIGAGGPRVKDGGRLEILDQQGHVTLTLAAEGLTLEGLIAVLGSIEVAGGAIVVKDADGVEQIRSPPTG